VRIIDIYGTSATLFCTKCEHFTLGFGLGDVRHGIFLSRFHVHRGDGPGLRPLHDLEAAATLVQCLLDGVQPTTAATADFGIGSADHLGALRHAVRCGCTAYDLDRVIGDGRAITELVNGAPGQPFGCVEYVTRHDEMSMDAANVSIAKEES
jgi:hypothetical protein